MGAGTVRLWSRRSGVRVPSLTLRENPAAAGFSCVRAEVDQCKQGMGVNQGVNARLVDGGSDYQKAPRLGVSAG